MHGFLATVQEKEWAARRSGRWLRPGWVEGGSAEATTSCTWPVPNFFFHATMAYAILRHNGVQLGKMDYIGSLPTREG